MTAMQIYTLYYIVFREGFFCKSYKSLVVLCFTCNSQGVDGYPVVLVLFVGIGTSQSEAGEESSKKVENETNDDKGCNPTDVACTKKNIFSKMYS